MLPKPLYREKLTLLAQGNPRLPAKEIKNRLAIRP